MTRVPVFATLDAMIAALWGDVPQPLIPENWREIPREVNEHDLARVLAEELTPEEQRIREIEDKNRQSVFALAGMVMRNEYERHSEAARKKPGPRRGYRMPPSTRRHQYRGKYKKNIWREAAMRARRAG